MEIKDVISDARKRMDNAVEDSRRKLAAVRTGRASVSLLDSVTVEYYGTQMPLNQVGTIHAPEPTMLTVQPFDPTQIGSIEKAIRASELGLNPSNDGKLVRVPIPPLTEERRKQMVKVVHEVAEEHRTAVRNVRRDANDHLKKMLKDKSISEDTEKDGLDQIQKLTDQHITRINEIAEQKEKDVMTV
ncbi:MAG TPA: ribosome recycling factor [Blastocatellia bacterium]|jgi:ribosome recycling factor|nr:ribosome recycling factor [Blastocatellia bacterium]